MDQTNTTNRVILPILGMLVSAVTTHQLFQPDPRVISTGDYQDVGILNDASELCCTELITDEAMPVLRMPRQPAASSEPAAISIWTGMRQAFAMPDVDEELIRPYIDEYTKHPVLLARLIQRGEPYLFHILERLEQHAMPAELALLPIIESRFDPFAVSPAGATGIWQFMPATGRDYGMRVDKTIDERLDPIVCADGMLYCYNEKGNVALVPVTPKKFEIVSSFKVEKGSGPHWAHPPRRNPHPKNPHPKNPHPTSPPMPTARPARSGCC